MSIPNNNVLTSQNYFFEKPSKTEESFSNNTNKLKWIQLSSQYRADNRWRDADCAQCTYANSLKEADVVIAHPHKTKIAKSRPTQIWMAQFWESEANYPPIDALSSWDLSISYRNDATYPSFAMITDTFNASNLLIPVPWTDKQKEEMMSVWMTNCGGGGRNVLLNEIKQQGVDIASYGSCNKDHDEKNPLNASGAQLPQQLLDLDKDSSPGRQKIVHSALHLFLFAAENSISDYYHTEKLYHGLMAGSIPVYYGADTVDEYVPKHSIIKTSDFENGAQLGQYLLKVAKNETLYESYLTWRKKPLPDYFAFKLQKNYQTTCGICDDISQRFRSLSL